MGRQPTRPGWYDDPDAGFGRQAHWDGENWTGATRGGARHFRRLLILVVVWVALYGMQQLGESLDTWEWVETSGTVEAKRSWYNGFWSERGVVVAHEDGMAFLYPAKGDPLDVGDRVTFYFDPDQPDFVEEPREPNAFRDETSFPKANAALNSPLASHGIRALLSLAVAAGLVLVIVWLRRREWRVPQ